MPYDSLNKLLKMFPYLFDKSETSNFYKSQKITNGIFKKIYNDLNTVYESFHLNKRLLVWKEQTEAYDYRMRFVSTFSLLKDVKIYCENNLIYEAYYCLSDDKSYSYLVNEIFHTYTPVIADENETVINHELYTQHHTIDEKIINFNYSYDATSDNIIPNEKYNITITTYDEYIIEKGFPENDESQSNIYDHDISLDEIGAENNVPRRQYTTINEDEYCEAEIIERYEKTDPPFNNQSTEDDYHYMKRLLTYLIKYHTTSLPVLEIWKLYGVDATLTNRDKHILRLFDENLHPADDGEFTWIPKPWEHKDFFVDEGNLFGEYFFVHANTVQPVKKQNVTFYMKFMNSLAEILTSDLYTVDIFLNGELLEEDFQANQYVASWRLLTDDPNEQNLFTFLAKKDGTHMKTTNINIVVRGCNNADFYVKADSTNEEGTLSNPFKTIEKAIDSVNGVYNLIAILGEIELQDVHLIKEDCTIIGCRNAKIINNIDNARFFNVKQGVNVTIQDITLETKENTVTLDNDIWINDNQMVLNETIVTPTVDYGVLLSDLNAPTFMKDIKLEGNKITYIEVNLDELIKLNDTTNLIKNLEIKGNKITYTEYTPVTTAEYYQNLPYIYLEDRLELITAVEKLELENNTLISTEYGEELAWEIKRHLI